MKGSLMLSLESSHSRMNKLAKDELITGAHTTLDSLIAGIESVTEQQVFQVGTELFTSDRIALTGLGPLSSVKWGSCAQHFRDDSSLIKESKLLKLCNRLLLKTF